MSCTYIKTGNVYVLWRNYILLIQRSKTDESMPLFWESPGGHFDVYTPCFDSYVSRKEALRELVEETGIHTDPQSLRLSSLNTLTKHIAYVYKIKASLPPKVKLSFEHSCFRWLNICDKIPTNTRPEVRSFILSIRKNYE